MPHREPDSTQSGTHPGVIAHLYQRIAELEAERDRYRPALYAVMDQLGSPDKRTSAYQALQIAKQAVYGTGPR